MKIYINVIMFFFFSFLLTTILIANDSKLFSFILQLWTFEKI